MAGRTRSRDARATPAGKPRVRRGLSVATRLAATVLAVGFFSMVAATLVGLSAGQQLGRSAVADALDSLSSSGSFDVVAQLEFYERLAEQMAASQQASEAATGFSSALSELSSLGKAELRPEFDQLLEAYEARYLEPLREGGDPVVARDVISDDPVAVYLQSAYALTASPVSPLLVDDAGDGSEWSRVHAQVHPAYRNAVRQAGLLDIYLVDAASERIVYSAAKGPELGTSLAVGPYRGTVVGRAADAAASADDGVVTDLSFYKGVPGVPVGAAAAAIRADGDLVAALVLTYDGSVYTDRLTSVVTASAAEDDGSDEQDPAEGDAEPADDLYLVGADGTTRSDPQYYLDDPRGFLDASQEAGVLREDDRDLIESNGTTVLVQPASDSTVNAALDGDTDAAERTSLTGSGVVNVTERVPVEDVEWYTVAEISSSAADAPLAAFRGILVVGASVFVVVLAFVAVAWATGVMRPVRQISERVGQAAIARVAGSDFEPVSIPDASPTELHRLAESFSSMGASLRRQQTDLQQARAQRLDVMKKMLPASVAQRIARGDVDELDEVPSVTVAVVVVAGLGALVHDDHQGEDRLLLDDLTGELDDIALEHGLDRIKVVGDSFFAACGHDRPYIDHAARTVAFAEHVAEAVRAVSDSSAVHLDTAIAVNTGPVTIGMSGGTRLVYDVWGRTVTTAHDLARMARPGEVVVTDATRARLPDDVALVPWMPGSAAVGERVLWRVVGARDETTPAREAEGAR